MVYSLKNIFWHDQASNINKILLLIFGITVLAIASQLSIPFQPVPLTFQSATVILIGMAYGPRHGSLVILGYYLAGICGLPVFADMSFGIQHFFGPTGGYLAGFLPAVFVSGYLAQAGFAKNIFTSFFAAILGASIIFAAGIMYLSQFIGLSQAISLGLLPFIWTEILKLMAVSLFIPGLWKK